MIGKYPAKMDDKGRLFVPSKLRQELGTDFFATIGVNDGHRCLTLYKADDWHTMENNYNNLPVSKRTGAVNLIFTCATECIPDKQYRFSLTENLLTYAGITRDVVLVGRAGQAEIWDAAEYNAFELENLTPEKLLASLEAIGL